MTRAPADLFGKIPAFQPPRYIAIEGPIRVGKSTLAQFLADRLHARRITGLDDNPFLADFYPGKTGRCVSRADVFSDRTLPAAARTR